ncbi:MAG: flagellar motor switch protein FliN [Treponema sp.]|jgi:flagellar motor switch protein FliN/FliY|nr:flagellar motor switch protein FliN [Treponema sp.]
MSDGALSQDEIDALLTGVDSSGLGSGSVVSAPAGASDADRQALQSFLASTVDTQSSTLSMMTGSTVSIKGPDTFFTNRDAFLAQLPEMVTVVNAKFTSGFPGEHLYLLPEAAAKSIAGLMTKEENITLDDMAMSVIQEAVGNIVGSQITALTGKTGNKSIANAPPQAANVPKAAAALPGGNFFVASYQLNLGEGQADQFWEILDPQVSADIAQSLSGGAAPSPMPAMGGMNGMAGMNGMNGMNGGSMGMAGMSMNGGRSGGMSMGQPVKVQPVQFPGLVPRPTPQEAGNIVLIMDVYMEMTVELGRTRKLIKEILGMGEGTIIELDKLAGEPVDILVNHKLIAKGEVVVIDENFGVRVTEIVSPMERMSDIG